MMAFENEDDEFTNLIQDTLDRHNFYRKKHQVPPLKIDSKLSKFSQEWADQLASVDKASHRPKNVYGENIFIIKSSAPVTELGIRAVDSWYDEIKYFNFQGTNDEMTASTKSLHFTQLIWKDSKDLGVGASKNPDSGKLYVVCNYNPRGNLKSQFKEKVLPSANNL